MSGPVEFARQVQALDQLLNAAPNWDGLEKAFAPAKTPDHFEPDDFMKQQLAALYNTADGRQIIDWLFDLTLRAPFPHVGSSRDSAWIAGAKHEARVAVGQTVARAIVDGRELFNRKKEPK